jgi:hypothetical protein
MENLPRIISELKLMEKRIDQKLDFILLQNPNPFPFERIKKGKRLKCFCKATRLLIEADLVDDARILLEEMEKEGLKWRQ